MPTIDPVKLKNRRKQADLRQGELASNLKWSQPRISQYENQELPERKEIKQGDLVDLANAIGCEPEDITVNNNAIEDTSGIDLGLWKESVHAINYAENKLGLTLTEDQKLTAALHLYSENIVSEKSAVSILKLFTIT